MWTLTVRITSRWPSIGDAELPAYRAAAVGGRAGSRTVPGNAFRSRGRGSWRVTPVIVLLERDQLVVESDAARVELFGSLFSSGSSRICGRFACRHGDAATQAGRLPPPSQAFHLVRSAARRARLPATSRYQAVWLMFSAGVLSS